MSQNGAKMKPRADRKHDFAVFGFVEAVFEHHSINDGDRCGGQRNAREPALKDAPAKNPISDGDAAQERCEEPDKPDSGCLLPVPAEHDGIEFCPGQEGEHNSPGAGDEGDPRRLI